MDPSGYQSGALPSELKRDFTSNTWKLQLKGKQIGLVITQGEQILAQGGNLRNGANLPK